MNGNPVESLKQFRSDCAINAVHAACLACATALRLFTGHAETALANHRRAARLAALAATVLLGACAGLGFRSDGPIAWETIDSDIYSGVSAEMQVTIRDQRTWSRLWAEHKGNRHYPAPLPRIDFSEEMVAGIFTGERPNGCHAVRIQRVYRRESRIIIEYSERIPSGPRLCNYAVTHPSHLIALPSSREPVEFVRMPDRPS